MCGPISSSEATRPVAWRACIDSNLLDQLYVGAVGVIRLLYSRSVHDRLRVVVNRVWAKLRLRVIEHSWLATCLWMDGAMEARAEAAAAAGGGVERPKNRTVAGALSPP